MRCLIRKRPLSCSVATASLVVGVPGLRSSATVMVLSMVLLVIQPEFERGLRFGFFAGGQTSYDHAIIVIFF